MVRCIDCVKLEKCAKTNGKSQIAEVVPGCKDGKRKTITNGDRIRGIDIEHAPTVIEAEEVYGQYTDTAGNFHWCGTHSGEHTVKVEDGE